MAIPVAVIRKSVDMETRRAMSRTNRKLVGRDLLWVEFYKKYSGLIVDFYDDCADVRLRMADYSYTPMIRLPYSRIWMWMDDNSNLLVYIEHPQLGPIYTIVNEKDTPDGNWDLALRLVRQGRTKVKYRMTA